MCYHVITIHLRALLGALGGESGQKCLLEVGVRRLRCGDTGRFCVSASGDPRPRLMSSRLRERGVMASPRCGTSGVTLAWSGLLLAVIVRMLHSCCVYLKYDLFRNTASDWMSKFGAFTVWQAAAAVTGTNVEDDIEATINILSNKKFLHSRASIQKLQIMFQQ